MQGTREAAEISRIFAVSRYVTLKKTVQKQTKLPKVKRTKRKVIKKKKCRVFLELRFVNENRNCQVRGKAVTVLHTRTNLAPVSQLINTQEIGGNPDKLKCKS